MYRKKVAYSFEADGHTWNVLEWSNDRVYLEEDRKNGTEECHTYATFKVMNGVWRLVTDFVHEWVVTTGDEEYPEPIVQYFGWSTIHQIETLLDAHGAPPLPQVVTFYPEP